MLPDLLISCNIGPTMNLGRPSVRRLTSAAKCIYARSLRASLDHWNGNRRPTSPQLLLVR